MNAKGRSPTLTDYMAGAFLGNGFIWMWTMTLSYLHIILFIVPPPILILLSFMIYVTGGAVASYLVCGRAEGGYLHVALKLIAAEWAFSLMMMLSIASEPSLGQALFLLTCFIIGGFIGAYLSTRRRLRRPSGD